MSHSTTSEEPVFQIVFYNPRYYSLVRASQYAGSFVLSLFPTVSWKQNLEMQPQFSNSHCFSLAISEVIYY